MDNKVVENNKKEDKIAFKKFIIIVLICSLVGGVLGFISGFGKSIFDGELTQQVAKEFVVRLSLYVSVVLAIIVIPVTSVMIRDCRKRFNKWDNEDEEEISKINGKIDITNMILNTSMIIGLIFYAITASQINELIYDKSNIYATYEKVIGTTGCFLLYIPGLIIQRLLVNLKKEINPRKKGSAFDFDIMKKWIDSCDEAEKVEEYRCGYVAFRAVIFTCFGLGLLYILAIIIWDLSIVPLIMVGIIGLVAIITYDIEEIKKSFRG